MEIDFFTYTDIEGFLDPPSHPFEAILLYDRNKLKGHVILCFRLQQRTTCVLIHC